jgi:hypothetical protein
MGNMRFDNQFIEQLLENPSQIQYLLFPEVDSDRAFMEVCMALNRFHFHQIEISKQETK